MNKKKEYDKAIKIIDNNIKGVKSGIDEINTQIEYFSRTFGILDSNGHGTVVDLYDEKAIKMNNRLIAIGQYLNSIYDKIKHARENLKELSNNCEE